MKLIHLSDLHIGGSGDEIYHFTKIIDAIGQHYKGTPVLITGDITDSATRNQMEIARDLLDALANTNPILTVPGNHDYAWAGNVLRDGAVGDWEELLGGPLGWPASKVLQFERSAGLSAMPLTDTFIIGVDTGDPNDHELSARGYVSPNLCTHLERALNAADTGITRVVMLHHHPFTDQWFTALEGSERLMDTLAGRCEVLLFGHNHRVRIWHDWGNSIPLVCASHKTTETILKSPHLGISVIEINNGKYWHRMELV